jgi:hypothetical protein
MTVLRRLSPLLVVALVLAGCAPAATGSSPGAPYPIQSSAIVAQPGKTVYVDAHFTFDDFGIDPTKVTGALWVPSGYNAESAVLTTKFSLGQIRVPAGWKLELVQVQGTRTNVEGPKSFSKTTKQYSVAVLLAVTPKDGAVAGPYHLNATLTYQKKSKPLRIDLHVG